MAPCVCVWRLIPSAEPKGSRAAAGPRRQLIHSASPSFNLSAENCLWDGGGVGSFPLWLVLVPKSATFKRQTFWLCSDVHSISGSPFAQGKNVMSLNDWKSKEKVRFQAGFRLSFPQWGAYQRASRTFQKALSNTEQDLAGYHGGE